MPKPKDWTEKDEAKALEGIDINKSDSSNFITFKIFRELMIENGWTGDKEESNLMYAIFNLYIDNPNELNNISSSKCETVEQKYDLLDGIYNVATDVCYNLDNEIFYNTIKDAYEKNKKLYEEAKAAEKKDEDPKFTYIEQARELNRQEKEFWDHHNKRADRERRLEEASKLEDDEIGGFETYDMVIKEKKRETIGIHKQDELMEMLLDISALEIAKSNAGGGNHLYDDGAFKSAKKSLKFGKFYKEATEKMSEFEILDSIIDSYEFAKDINWKQISYENEIFINNSKMEQEEIERRRKEQEEAERKAKEEEKREREAEEAKRKAEEDKRKAEEAKKKKEAEEELKRAQIEEQMRKAEEEAKKKAEKLEAEKRLKELEEQNRIKNAVYEVVKQDWIAYVASKKAYDIVKTTIPGVENNIQRLMDYYNNDNYFFEVELEIDGVKRKVLKPFSYFEGNLDRIEPKDWTKEELELIDRYANSLVTYIQKSKQQKFDNEKENQRLAALEKEKPRMSVEQINSIQAEIRRLKKEKDIDIIEFEQSPGYRAFCEANNQHYDSAEAPIALAVMTTMGKSARKELLSYNQDHYKKIMDALKKVEELDEKVKQDKTKYSLYDGDAFAIMRYLNTIGYKKLILNDKKEEIGEVFDFETALNTAGKDRDNTYGFEPQIIQDAKQLFQDNKANFEKIFDSMSNLGGRHTVGQEILNVDRENLEKVNKGEYPYDSNTLKKLNQFCHKIYQVKQVDEKVCKLGTDENPTFVEPFGEKTHLLSFAVRQKEISILDKCKDMLESCKSSFSNSDEYKNIIKEIKKLKRIVNDGIYDNGKEANEAYAKGIKKVLKAINLYRKHKADDGVKQDITTNKLIAVERIDKLLRTRYEAITKEQYKDVINSVGDVANPVVDEKFEKGREYVLAVAYSRISGIRNNKSVIDKGLEEEKAAEQKAAEDKAAEQKAAPDNVKVPKKEDAPKKETVTKKENMSKKVDAPKKAGA